MAVILDGLYEEKVDLGEPALMLLGPMTARLQEMVDPSSASRALPHLHAALLAQECSSFDLACGILAAVVTLGHLSLSKRLSVDVADEWALLWADRVSRHNHQQDLHCRCSIIAQLPEVVRSRVLSQLDVGPATLLPRGVTFVAGIKEYLECFSDTAGAAMALVGVLPFAERLRAEDQIVVLGFLREYPEFLRAVGELLRLAQDVRVDPSEPLSCGIFASAAERAVRLTDVSSDEPSWSSIEPKLRAEWPAHAHDAGMRMDACLASLPAGRPRDVLVEIRAVTSAVAEALLGAPHKDPRPD